MNTLKLLVPSAFMLITLSTPQTIHSMENEQKDPLETSRKVQAESQDAPPPYKEPEQVQASMASPSRGTDLSLPFSADECYAFALMHHYGNGVPQDHERARDWYKKAAAQGNVDAQNAIKELEVLEVKETAKQPTKELAHKKEPPGGPIIRGGSHYKGMLASVVIGLLVGGNWKELTSKITPILPDAPSFLELPTQIDHCRGFTSLWHWTACAELNRKAMPAVLPRDDRWFLQPPTHINHCGGFTSVWHLTVCNELKEAEKLRIERLKEAEKQRVESLQKEMATREKRFVFGLKAYDIMESPLTTTDEMIKIKQEVVDFINEVPLPSPSKDSEFSEEKQKIHIRKAREALILSWKYGVIRYMEQYDTKLQAQRHIPRVARVLAEIVDFIKKDLIKTMELHKKIHGVPHPHWDKFNPEAKAA